MSSLLDDPTRRVHPGCPRDPGRRVMPGGSLGREWGVA
ncbi:hypothetical protein FRAHR75_230028 [Frankia sp. Hr75.2]|nr:hypothetical protein FRAHR75_230028 [Frankia sp. Hr75.2]SQD97114.1 hypothetical protein FMEAI12_3940032 [Parafrankia sp. Ea1.12]